MKNVFKLFVLLLGVMVFTVTANAATYTGKIVAEGSDTFSGNYIEFTLVNKADNAPTAFTAEYTYDGISDNLSKYSGDNFSHSGTTFGEKKLTFYTTETISKPNGYKLTTFKVPVADSIKVGDTVTFSFKNIEAGDIDLNTIEVADFKFSAKKVAAADSGNTGGKEEKKDDEPTGGNPDTGATAVSIAVLVASAAFGVVTFRGKKIKHLHKI